MNHLDPRPRQRDSLADANPPDGREPKRHSGERETTVIARYRNRGQAMSWPGSRGSRFSLPIARVSLRLALRLYRRVRRFPATLPSYNLRGRRNARHARSPSQNRASCAQRHEKRQGAGSKPLKRCGRYRTIFDSTLKQALRVQLEQSPFHARCARFRPRMGESTRNKDARSPPL